MRFLPRLSSVPLIVVILFSADLLFILLHVSRRVALAPAKVEFDLTRDHSLGEAFGYLKLYWIALLLLWMAFRRGRRSALPWALLFGYLMLDDLLRLHETGAAAARWPRAGCWWTPLRPSSAPTAGSCCT